MQHLENIDAHLDALEKDSSAHLDFIVGRAPVMDVCCDTVLGIPRFSVRLLKSLAPKSGPVIIETSDRSALLHYLRVGFSGVFLGGSYRSAGARFVAAPAAS